MTLDKLRGEYLRLTFPKTIADSLDLLNLYSDFFINLIHTHHKTPYKDREENESRLVLQMVFSKVLSIKQIVSGVEFTSKSGIALNKIIDPTIIGALVRNVYETVAMFNLIFRSSQKGDERTIVYNLWVLAGLNYRQRFKDRLTTDENIEKHRQENERISSLIFEIRETSLYKALDDRNKRKIDLKIKDKDYLIGFSNNAVAFLSWQELSSSMKMKPQLFDKMYTYFSLYAHPSNVSVFQFADMFKHEKEFTELTIFNLQYLYFLLGIFTADYLTLFPDLIELFNKMDILPQIVINTHNTFSRGYDMSINDAWKSLG